eukprot:12893687-Prorocentrum_lima.AAC.1
MPALCLGVTNQLARDLGQRPHESGFYEEWAEWLQEMDSELQLRFGVLEKDKYKHQRGRGLTWEWESVSQ